MELELDGMPSKKAGAAHVSRPMNGAEFLASLRDGREVWIYGERVKDVTAHPAFRNTARMLARMYDALHDPGKKSILTTATDTGGYTHRFYRVDRSVEQAVALRDAIAEWARISDGWMGRSPDYKASFLGTLGANSEFSAPYQRIETLLINQADGCADALQDMVRRCMDEYNLDG